MAFFCNCGNDLIGTKKESRVKSKGIPKAPAVQDVSVLNEPGFDLDLGFESMSIAKEATEESVDEIEHIAKKQKVSSEEIAELLEYVDVIEDANLNIILEASPSAPTTSAPASKTTSLATSLVEVATPKGTTTIDITTNRTSTSMAEVATTESTTTTDITTNHTSTTFSEVATPKSPTTTDTTANRTSTSFSEVETPKRTTTTDITANLTTAPAPTQLRSRRGREIKKNPKYL